MQKHIPDDIARFITGRLLNNHDTAGLPWQGHPAAVPEHALTGQLFTGINVLLLWQAAKRYSLDCNRWLTGDDLRQAGGTVIPGQKPVTLVRYRPALSLMKVINLAQCEGLPDALQPGWPLPPQPAANHGVISRLVTASGVPVVFREGAGPVYRPLHDRIELAPVQYDGRSYGTESSMTYGNEMLRLLVRASGHPQRLSRYGLTVDERTDSVYEALVTDIGTAFLAARLGLPGNRGTLRGGQPDADVLQADPWRLFRAADDARRAAEWLLARRPVMGEVDTWLKMAAFLLSHHYGLAPEETLLTSPALAQRHIDSGITPLMAVNALARIYRWERTDLAQRALFAEELSPDSELLALAETRPELLCCLRRYGENSDAETTSRSSTAALPLLPPPVAEEGDGAANDDGPDEPDDNVVALPWAARRGRTNPHIQEFVSLFNSIAPHENRWQVFSDFAHMAAAALYNAVHRDPTVEADYLRRVKRYSKEDAVRMSGLLAAVTDGLEFSPTDFLGQLLMTLELGNQYLGQYFTPYSVSCMMARMNMADRLPELEDGSREYISVCDPACGAGGMIVATAEAMLEAGYNPQKQMLAYCTDIDPLAAMLCYIQLTLMHIPAVVCVGNSLTMEITREMATPAYRLGLWDLKLYREQTERESRQHAA
ncbi:TPA: N-6 DNA methylase [Salmonella enterica]|uniref:N-6 DNA methylase n=1 Tax=Salmonella enterica TaxID=28901 RepID=A0A756I698_SALER|nr:N-6 DNA methylase [Salmonella enterica]